MEYPTYGIYTAKGVNLEEEQFENDGQSVYDFFVENLGLSPDQIIIMGRSIGSGPATLLASKRKAGVFILFSPLISVREVAIRIPKIGWLAKMFISSNLFNNAKHIKDIHTPTFIVHGLQDEVVPHNHGQSLHDLSPVHNERKYMHSVNGMTHNRFKLNEDFIEPGQRFLDKIGLLKSPALRPIDIAPFIAHIKYYEFTVYIIISMI